MFQPKFEGNGVQRTDLLSVTRAAFEVVKVLSGVKTPIYLYGGAIRNMLLGAETFMPDYDFIGDFDLDTIQYRRPDLVVKRNYSHSTLKLSIGGKIFDLSSSKDVQGRLSINDITVSTSGIRIYH